ncbi:MAG: hypothetical protein IH614_06775 [Desulfuromonadales bacterium]|nr:hypothetical protein [Desulfuromonadales bacterium]
MRIWRGSNLVLALALALAFVLVVPEAEAKEGRDRDRYRFYGWVELMPEGLHGTWVIGGQDVVTNPRTEFDQMEGPLMVGGCAKVDIRRGLVHEIDSEPASNCR